MEDLEEVVGQEGKDEVEIARAKYRLVLLSRLGIEVFRDILAHLHFGRVLNYENPEMIAEHNVGMWLISQCGDFDEVMQSVCSVRGAGGSTTPPRKSKTGRA